MTHMTLIDELAEALKTSHCPRPIQSAEDETVGCCVRNGTCGCDNGLALARYAATKAEGAQAPVAYLYRMKDGYEVLTKDRRDWAESGSGLWTETPLYTAPQSLPDSAQPDQVQAVAWMHEDDDRVINARQKETAQRDGGASASSTKPYTRPLYPAPPAAPSDGATVSAALRQAFEEWFMSYKAVAGIAELCWEDIEHRAREIAEGKE